MAVAFAVFISFFIVLFATPSFIQVANIKNLFDEPSDKRKLHKKNTPSMGGIMIFAGTLFSFFICFPEEDLGYVQYLIPCILTMFFIGMKDDIIGTAPVKKLMGNILVAMLMVIVADVKIDSLYGLFGIREIPEWAAILLSVFTYVVVINAFNLIDGVDGLAGGVGFIASVVFGIWFLLAGSMVDAILAFSLSGALLGFLRYNFHPANIFMGDSGSLTIGLIICVLAIRLISFEAVHLPASLIYISKPLIVMAVLVYPLLDTFRIFIYRTIHKTSPFQADNNHIHHRLLKMGLSQSMTVLIIYLFTALLVITVVSLRLFNPNLEFFILLSIVFGTLGFLYFMPFKNNSIKVES